MDQAEALTEYRKLVKDSPSDKEGARRSFYDTFKVDPEGFTQPKGEVSRMAGERLKHMNPNAPEGPGMIERGLGKVIGDELAARMKEELPAAAGIIAMAAVPEAAIPKAATWGPKMLAFAKAAATRVLASSAAAGGTSAVLSGSAPRGAEEAKTQAMYGAAGEVVLGAGQAVVGGAKAIAPGALKYLRGTTGGRVATKEAVDAINEHAQKTVDTILASVGPKMPVEITGEEAGTMIKKFDRAASDAALELFEVPKTLARGAKLAAVDITPIANDLKEIVKADEKSGGFMSALATLDSRAASVAGGARKAGKDVGPLAADAFRAAQSGTPEGAAASEQMRKELESILKSRKAEIPALINIRGKVSQILADESAPAELKLVAKRIGTQRLDSMIETGLDQVGAGETWRAAVKNYANTAAIKEQALYKLAKKAPERLHEFIAPNRPDSVATLRQLEAKTGSNLIPDVQRNFLEARLGKGIQNFPDEIDKFGTNTVNALFSDPKGAASVSGLKDLSKAVTDKLTAVGAEAEGTREALALALSRAAVPGVGGAAVGASVGYKAGGTPGAVAGGVAGGAAGVLAPYQLVKLANKPETIKRLTTLISGLRADSPPAVINAIARTVGSVVNQ